MSNVKIISVPGFLPPATLFGDNEIIINNIDGKLYIKNTQNNTLRVINQDSDKNIPLDGDFLINKKIEFKEKKDSDSILFISSSGKQSRIGVGTTSPESTIDFKSVEDSTIGTELILRTARSATTGAFSGDEGGSINFTIDSGSFNNLKNSGSLAKIKTIVNSVGVGGVQGILALELSKGAGPEGVDVFKYGYQIGGENTFAQIQTGSLIMHDFSSGQPAKINMNDHNSNTTFEVFQGNITASGDISSSGTITSNEYIGLPTGLVSESAQILTDAGANQILASNSDATAITASGILFRASDSSIGIGVANTSSIDARLHIVGTGTANNREVLFKVNNSDDHDRIEFIDEGSNLPAGLRNNLATYGVGIYANSGPVRLFSGGTGSADTILRANSSNVEISGALDVTGQLSINGFSDVSASLAAAGGGSADNLGNHTATQDLDLGNNDIKNILNITASGDISSSGLITSLSASIDHVLVNSKLQGNGSGFQFFAFNEDTVKVKFANWYSSNDRQYGQGQLWYETWFAAIDNQSGRDNRRIGFYLEEPDAGATDADGGTSKHPSNSRFYVDITGSYIASGGLYVSDASFEITSTGNITASGDISSSGDLTVANINGTINGGTF